MWKTVERWINECAELGIVRSERDAARLMARAPSYLSSKKARGRPPATEALVALYVSLGDSLVATQEAAATAADPTERQEYLDALAPIAAVRAEVWAAVEQRVRQLVA